MAAAAFIFIIVNAPAEAPIPEGTLARYEGLQQTRTEDGFPRLGDPDAPVKVSEFSSFDCPHCRDFHDEAIDQIVDRVKTGQVSLTYVPLYGFGAVANGQGAAAAAVCAAEQDKFWQLHDALFDWQGIYSNQAFTNNRINAGIDAFGLDRGEYNACISSGRANDALNAAKTQQGQLLNFSGTPTITINGFVPVGDDQQPLTASADIIARIDAEIARIGSQPSTPEVLATAEATQEVTQEATESPAETAALPTDEADATPEATPAS
ncbi:MAG: thioredoxin domain-containing protein [Chloroflexota bacterium]